MNFQILITQKYNFLKNQIFKTYLLLNYKTRFNLSLKFNFYFAFGSTLNIIEIYILILLTYIITWQNCIPETTSCLNIISKILFTNEEYLMNKDIKLCSYLNAINKKKTKSYTAFPSSAFVGNLVTKTESRRDSECYYKITKRLVLLFSFFRHAGMGGYTRKVRNASSWISGHAISAVCYSYLQM